MAGFGPMYVLNIAASATDAGVWVPLNFDRVTQVSIHVELDGDATGTFAVNASNDPRCRPDHYDHANVLSDDVTSDFGLTDPAGSAADETTPFVSCSYAGINIAYTHSSGTGGVKVMINAAE